MGPAFVILFWLVLLAIASAIWVAGLGLYLAGCRRKSRWMKWVGGVPLVAVTLAMVLVVSLFAYGVVRSSNPRWVYEDVFGAKPTADVSEIHSSTWSFADSGYVLLRFKANRTTFDRIRPKELSTTTREELRPSSASGGKPAWWREPSDRALIYAGATGFGKGKEFASEWVEMHYEETIGTVFYSYLGID